MKYWKTYVIKHTSVAKSCILQYFTRVRITKNFIIFENQVKHKFRVKEYLIQQIDYLLVLTAKAGPCVIWSNTYLVYNKMIHKTIKKSK